MRRMLAMLVVLVFAESAQAQLKPIDPLIETTLACLKKTDAAIAYPEQDLAMRRGGMVRFGLRFTAPDRAPEVEVYYRNASDEMLSELHWYVRAYRVPCMQSGAVPVSAVQEFVFTPRQTDPVTWSQPRPLPDDENAAKHEKEIFACLRNGKQELEYSGSYTSREAANALVQLKFTSADAPPEVTWLYSSLAPVQQSTVLDYVRHYRVPCLPPGTEPVIGRQHFHFSPPDAERRAFKGAVPLMSFLSSIKGVRSLRADFDFETMSCPFQVAWQLGRPALEDNSVGQLGKSDPNRTEFLAWLAKLEMALKPRELQALLGESLVINVPCGRLLLEPKS